MRYLVLLLVVVASCGDDTAKRLDDCLSVNTTIDSDRAELKREVLVLRRERDDLQAEVEKLKKEISGPFGLEDKIDDLERKLRWCD